MKHIIYRLIMICTIIGSMGASPFRPAIVMAEDTPSDQDIAIPSPTPSVQPDPSVTSTPVASVSASTANTQAQPTSSALGPVIFVPGIMGSYLDVDGCNVWPGVGRIIKYRQAYLPWWLPFNDLMPPQICATLLPNKNVLALDSQKTVKATDAIRCISLYPTVNKVTHLLDPYEVAQIQYSTCAIGNINAQYSELIKRLLKEGYREYQTPTLDANNNSLDAVERCEEAEMNDIPLAQSNLYVLGYDWRQKTADSADKLQALVDCVYRRHNMSVDLVGHSMGGLVIKQYVLENADSSTKIDSISTLNTPYLGAVRAVNILGTGKYEGVTMLFTDEKSVIDLGKIFVAGSATFICLQNSFILDFLGILPNATKDCFIPIKNEVEKITAPFTKCDKSNYPDTINECVPLANRLKSLSRTFPGAIELLPASLYLQQFPCRFALNNSVSCTSNEHWNHISAEFGSSASSFRLSEDVQRDDTGASVARTQTIDYLIQFSSNTADSKARTTISKVTKTGANWSYEYGPGDGTVNEFSLTRQNADTNYNPRSSSDRKVFIYGYCNQDIDHNGIVFNTNTNILDRLVKFLRNPVELNDTQNTCINGNSVPLTDLQTAAVVLNEPTSGFVSTNGLWPALKWSNNPAISAKKTNLGYRLQVSANADMSNPVVDECLTGISYAPINPMWAQSMMGTYYWRVNRVFTKWNPKQPESCKVIEPVTGWSDIRSFTNPVNEKRPQLNTPIEGETTIYGNGVSLDWSTGNMITPTFGYRVQVSTDINFADSTQMVIDRCAGTDWAYVSSEKLQTMGTYYWRVNYATKTWKWQNPLSCTSDPVNASLWSSTGSFSNTRPDPVMCKQTNRDWDVCGNDDVLGNTILEAQAEGFTWSGHPLYRYIWPKNKPLRVKTYAWAVFRICNEDTNTCQNVAGTKSLTLQPGNYTMCYTANLAWCSGFVMMDYTSFYGNLELVNNQGLEFIVK
jgi:hypothetical protein